MSETSGFFDAHIVGNEYDRVYLAENFAKYFASFIGNGVFGGRLDSLAVVAKEVESMRIDVKSGQAWINGYWYENDNAKELRVDLADGVLNRIDAVVVRYTVIDRAISVVIKKGTPAVAAQAPSMQRDANAWELCIAQIKINAGAIKVTNGDITDTRLDKNLCGQVTGTVSQIDTTAYGAQLNSFIANYIAKANRDYNELYIYSLNDLKAKAQTEYNAFVSALNGYRAQGENAMTAYLTWLASLQTATAADIEQMLEEFRGLIDSETATALTARVLDLEAERPTMSIATLTHDIGSYPHCEAYWLEYGAGVQPCGTGACGCSGLTSSQIEYTMPDEKTVNVKVQPSFGTVEAVTKLPDRTNTWVVTFVGSLKSILIVLTEIV